ncbi:acylphosphatase [Desulfoplanes formicivorans]|uniref:acylphosphatase n=1 Tax=Desulfoplanes formicivorans TaxID=1592317 RepID=A0A194AFA6_9BACT|nr:acylphosphatase [Desulfoplanes formicivorans]GAU07880.1 acylphosphatase [Desulfoplanes formicivorans]
MTKSLQCIVTGKVQGVNFRAWTHDQAKALGLTGWVRNLKENQVEVLLQGPEDKIEEMKKRLIQGSELSRIDKLDAKFIDYDKQHTSFQIRG